MEFTIFSALSPAVSVILHWLRGARVYSTVTLGAEIKSSHGSFRAGEVISMRPNKFNEKFPPGLNLAQCDPVFIVIVFNKGRMATTLKSIGIDNKSWCLTNTFHGRISLPHRLIEKSGEFWFTDFSIATFVSFETKGSGSRPKKIGAFLEFADGTKSRSLNKLSPTHLKNFASNWNQELEISAKFFEGSLNF